jgi:enoyl-CoA hydratase
MAETQVITATHTVGVRHERVGASAVVTLDRGRALNALTPEMVADLAARFARFGRDTDLYVVVVKSADAKAFCAGGDVRALSALALTDFDAACAALQAEYRLNWVLECFTKPCVVLMDGLVMGSGVGISAYATHKVAGSKYRFAMPETAIGFFPDVGTAYALARMPHRIGIYLGLTGHGIGRADAFALGVVTHCLEVEQFGEVEARLAEAWPVDTLLDAQHRDPGVGALAEHVEMIDGCFSGGSVEEILERLADVTGPSAAFAQVALADLRTRSPRALKVTLRHIREAGSLDLRQTLEMDFRLAVRLLAERDFHEGVRAALLDKDHAPRWVPASLADVTENILGDVFAAMPGAELGLPLRQEMQGR